MSSLLSISRWKTIFTILLISFLHNAASAQKTNTPAKPLTAAEAKQLATEAYVYLYPLLSMEITYQQATNIEAGKRPGFGPVNEFHHMRQYPDANFRTVVRPNFDTLYSSAWLDLSKEPMLISMPATNGRYYILPIMDMWSDVVGAAGARTTGTDAQVIAIVRQGWKGTLPKGAVRLEVPTPGVWIIGRVQANGPADYENVHKIQDQMSVTPLSQWGKKRKPAPFKVNPTIDMETEPLMQVNGMAADKYFAMGSRLLAIHPPHVTDWSQIQRISRIGIDSKGSFDIKKFSPEIQQAIIEGHKAGLELMKEKLPTLARVINGWQMNTDTMGVYGDYYLKRAIVALVGLGANQPEDAIYPLLVADKNGKPVTADNKYTIHFEANQLPPNSAFWSITAYDAEGFQTANELNRFAIGDRDQLKFNKDGSLDLYFQNKRPSEDKVSNWLPTAPKGVLGLTMRIYAPAPQALDGRWNPPPVVRQ